LEQGFMIHRMLSPALCFAGAVLLLAGCNSGPVSSAPHQNGNLGWDPGTGSFLPNGAVIFGGKSSPSDQASAGTGIGVNAYLWRGALDTLSFMPLASADPFGGVIITDWYQPSAATGERFKATAYILGRQLRADGVRISLFRQVQENGQWVDSPVAATTTADIENKVLARARELRAQSAQN
jgi:hypothetical protein